MASLRLPSTTVTGVMSGPIPVIQAGIANTNLTAQFLQDFFRSWLKLNITQLASMLTILATATTGFGTIKGVSSKIYWWFVRHFTSSISVASNDKLNAGILTAQTERVQNGGYYQPARRPEKIEEVSKLTISRNCATNPLPCSVLYYLKKYRKVKLT
jgi:hypothetical protein